tara:strand:+ start:3248 stop:4717 length:1470 start_codon:yes stop_codon:yes gene_type:complete
VAELTIKYTPFAKQIQAHARPEPIVGYFGGWGSGKTTWAIAEAFRNTCCLPGIPGILTSPTFPVQRKTLYPAIVRIFPGASRWPRGREKAKDCLGPLVRDWNAQDRVLTLDIGNPKTPASRGGTDWFFGSLDDPGSIEGGTYGWGIMDEPRLATHEAWRIFNSRVRDPRASVHRRSVSGVPSMGWMHDEFNKGLPGRAYVQASSRDNPHLPKDYVDSLNLTGRMAEAYIHGGFVSIEGVVYFTYEPREGESLIETAPDPECATYGALDFGRRRPFFMIVQEQVHEGEVVDVIVDEVPGSDILEETHAYQCAKMLVDHKIQMLDVFCDPAGGSTNAQTGISSIAIYEKAFRKANVLVGGMRFTTSRTDRHIPAGVEATRALFQNHAGKRRLFVAKHLTDPDRTTRYPDGVAGVHASLMGYSYPKNKPNEAMPDKKSSAGYDHAMDALRYFVINKYGVMDAPSMLDLNPPPMSHIIGDHAFADPMDHPDNW